METWAKLWPTPRSSANENRTTKPAPSHGKTHGRVLAGEAGAWATPTVRDYKDGFSGDCPMETNSRLGLQAPRMVAGGDDTLQPVALNPQFVEALMGLPIGWTDCAASATESFRSWFRVHSGLLQRVLR